MSDRNIARHAEVSISFAGTDITKDISPYLLSLDYTDNESDEADDLRITLQDRDGIWEEKWLNDAVQAAAAKVTVSTASSSGPGSAYRVMAKIGLNVRSGPGTGYSRIGAFCFGATATVLSISGGWAKVKFNGREGYSKAQYLTPISGGKSSGATVQKTSGMKISAVIVLKNADGNGGDQVLDCGEFELDDIRSSGPPATVTISATALPFESSVRQSKRTKGWEAYRLSGIAKEIGDRAGMGVMYLAKSDPYYTRREQYLESDIAFLSRLCRAAGLSLKATNNALVLFDQAEFDAKDASVTLEKGKSRYTRYSFQAGKAGTEYQSCRVRYTDPTTGRCISGTAYVEDYDAKSEKNQQLEVTAKVANAAEAKALASKLLRLHNKYERTGSVTMPGNPTATAGKNMAVKGFGFWDGKYAIKTAKHSVGSGGYVTTLTLRKALEDWT